MAQTVPEAQKETPVIASPEAMDKGMPIEQAAVEAAQVEENLDSKSAADAASIQELDTTMEHEVVKDAARLGAIDQDVTNAGVQEVGEHVAATETVDALAGTGVQVTGEVHPATKLGETQGTFNNETPQGPSTLPAFNALESGKFGDGEGSVLDAAVKKRWGFLKFAHIPKLFAGKKEPQNITPLPQPAASQNQERKAA